MAALEKGNSPFYPNHPVPPEFFVGRSDEIERVRERGIRQVANGKMVPFYIQGEYGIGKTSFAKAAQQLGETYGLHPIYCSVGGARDLSDFSAAVLQAALRSGGLNTTKEEALRNWLGKYIGRQELFGFSLNMEVLRQDAPQLSNPFGLLGFLDEIRRRLNASGVFLVVDEINGIADSPEFAHFIKGLVDSTGSGQSLLLALCGTEERRRRMIQNHQPVDRIFDIVEISPMSQKDSERFFEVTFSSVNMETRKDAVSFMAYWAAGFPKIMQLVGDEAYWAASGNVVDQNVATLAVTKAAGEVGARYVDQQVYRALRSADYRSILKKIAAHDGISPDMMSFQKAEVAGALTESEPKKFNNFLQKMKRLNVLRSGDVQGEYRFNQRMVALYIRLQTIQEGS